MEEQRTATTIIVATPLRPVGSDAESPWNNED